MILPFTKMHGLGNDFVVLDFMRAQPSEPIDFGELAKDVCRRGLSVGADGLLVVLPEEGVDARMRIFNADGSEAQMCGNGIRCVARLLHDRRYSLGRELRIATKAGVRSIAVTVTPDGCFAAATVDMGQPEFEASKVPAIGVGRLLDIPVNTESGTYILSAVSMGNPHGVVFVDDVDAFPVHEVGAQLEVNPLWPEKANIEFASINGHDIKMRAWERGVGETLACGTGACAVAAAAIATGRGTAPFDIEIKGGMLHIDVSPSGSMLMTGPAEVVFKSEICF